MKITAEVLDNEIKGMQQQKWQYEALVAKADGALTVLQGLRTYLDKEEVKAVEQALSEQQVVEAVGGVGSKSEGVEVVNALGKYENKGSES